MSSTCRRRTMRPSVPPSSSSPTSIRLRWRSFARTMGSSSSVASAPCFTSAPRSGANRSRSPSRTRCGTRPSPPRPSQKTRRSLRTCSPFSWARSSTRASPLASSRAIRCCAPMWCSSWRGETTSWTSRCRSWCRRCATCRCSSTGLSTRTAKRRRRRRRRRSKRRRRSPQDTATRAWAWGASTPTAWSSTALAWAAACRSRGTATAATELRLCELFALWWQTCGRLLRVGHELLSEAHAP
mmetsp:Transcript_11575/g.23322  ORF Transcript_11575/g.23322 Transcript_11575/m.23322 type:complete len:241 (-) Transcript_11575:615-1337(-)